MLLASVSLVFTLIFGMATRRFIPRGLQFARFGWDMLQANAPDEAKHKHIEGRQAIGAGGNFVIAGTLWLLAGVICAVLTLFFGWQTLIYSGFIG